MWLRQELPVQRIRTVGLLLISAISRPRIKRALDCQLDFLPHADFLGSGFQPQNVELLEGQGGQELKTASYLLGDLPESSPFF